MSTLTQRGKTRPEGSEFTNKNGYTYVKVGKEWQPKQKVIAEEKLGRPLQENERAYFRDGNRYNLGPENIGVKIVEPKVKTPKSRLAEIEFELGELEARKEDLLQEKAQIIGAGETRSEI